MPAVHVYVFTSKVIPLWVIILISFDSNGKPKNPFNILSNWPRRLSYFKNVLCLLIFSSINTAESDAWNHSVQSKQPEHTYTLSTCSNQKKFQKWISNFFLLPLPYCLVSRCDTQFEVEFYFCQIWIVFEIINTGLSFRVTGVVEHQCQSVLGNQNAAYKQSIADPGHKCSDCTMQG